MNRFAVRSTRREIEVAAQEARQLFLLHRLRLLWLLLLGLLSCAVLAAVLAVAAEIGKHVGETPFRGDVHQAATLRRCVASARGPRPCRKERNRPRRNARLCKRRRFDVAALEPAPLVAHQRLQHRQVTVGDGAASRGALRAPDRIVQVDTH